MYKIKNWAHDAAQQHNFNPWAASKDEHGLSNPESSTVDGAAIEAGAASEPPKKSLFRRIYDPFKVVAFHSWMNLLLVFVPVGVAVHFAGVNPNVVFALNAIAVIPLAGLLTFATESVAHRLGPTLGALMNVSFGNAVELIIFIIALIKNEIRVVQASLVGSILANLLLILGMALLVGGLNYQEQVYDSLVTQMSAALLCVATLSLLIPTAFHASFSDLRQANEKILPVSRGTSVILLLVYVLYLLFQLKSHSYLYQGTPQHIIDQSTQPGILQRLDSTSTEGTASSSSTSIHSSSSGGTRRRVRKKLRAKLGRKRKTQTINEDVDEVKSTTQNNSALPSGSVVNEKLTAEPESIEGSITEPAATVAANVALPGSLGANRRPLLSARGLSIRPPPVFRGNSSLAITQSPSRGHQLQLPASQLRRLHSTPNMVRRGASDPVRGGSGGLRDPVRSSTGLSHFSGPKEPVDEPPLSQMSAIILLLISTGLVALCAEFLVGSIEHLVENSPLSEAFVGLIILPIVGNAAEHVTAVTVAAKNKLDLSMGVSLGSSIQIALFVTPLVVIIGWIANRDMTLYFTLFETVALFASVFIVNFLVLDGRSNFLEGALLCACYVIIGLGSYYYPDGQEASATVGGGSQ